MSDSSNEAGESDFYLTSLSFQMLAVDFSIIIISIITMVQASTPGGLQHAGLQLTPRPLLCSLTPVSQQKPVVLITRESQL